MTIKTKVLCVDDEPQVLSGLKLQLRKKYDVSVATSGSEALEVLAKDHGFGIILSDMRMPEMNGAEFLSQVRIKLPDATRMLLTGQSDLESAIAAINDGGIFRFLAKPCDPKSLHHAFEEAEQQYKLINSKKILLENTLRGSVKILADVLSLTSPSAFGRSHAVKTLAVKVAKKVGLSSLWQLEIAATLAHLGSVALDEQTLSRLYSGGDLNKGDLESLAEIPSMSCDLIGNIPHLEDVKNIIMQLCRSRDPVDSESKIIKMCDKYIERTRGGRKPEVVLSMLRDECDEAHLDSLSEIIYEEELLLKAKINLSDLTAGMVLADDIRHINGSVLVTARFQVNNQLLSRLRSVGEESLEQPLLVYMPKL